MERLWAAGGAVCVFLITCAAGIGAARGEAQLITQDNETFSIEVRVPSGACGSQSRVDTSGVSSLLKSLTPDLTRLYRKGFFDRLALEADASGQPRIGMPVPQTLVFGLPYDTRASAFRLTPQTRSFLQEELRRTTESLRDAPDREREVPLALVLASIGVSLIPLLGDAYDGLCAATQTDVITQQHLSPVEVGVVVAGLATGVGSGMLARKLYKSRVVVFSQLAYDPNGANQLTRVALKKVAGKPFRRFRFKFVDLGEIAPQEATRLVRKELKRGRTVILNAHGDWDGIYLGSPISRLSGGTVAQINRELTATAGRAIVKNGDLVPAMGRNLGGSVLDGSCFNSTRRSAWERIVGARGRVVTLADEGPDTGDALVEMTPLLIDGKLGKTYEYYFNGLPFSRYVHGPGTP